MQKRLGMRHQTEKPARLVAQACDGQRRAVGILRILHRELSFGRGVAQDDQIFLFNFFQNSEVCRNELAFAVAHGIIDHIEAARKHAGALVVGLQIHPTVFKAARVIERKRRGLLSVVAPQRRQQSQLHHQLKSVTDAQNEAACMDEFEQFFDKHLAGVGNRRVQNSKDEAAILQMRADLMADIRKFIKTKKITQAEAAKIFGVSQSRVSDLITGKWEKFSLEMLIILVTKAGMHVKLKIAA